MSFQLTIERSVETEGIGLHTAAPCHLRLVPAPADTGIVFRRVDLDNFEVEVRERLDGDGGEGRKNGHSNRVVAGP